MTRTMIDDAVLEAIVQFNRGRKRKLVRLKLRRMLDDPFTFFRGTNHLFARAWPELHPPEVGPDILICGDLHLENFGAYRTSAGRFPLRYQRLRRRGGRPDQPGPRPVHDQHLPGRRAVDADADGGHRHGPGLPRTLSPGHPRRGGSR